MPRQRRGTHYWFPLVKLTACHAGKVSRLKITVREEIGGKIVTMPRKVYWLLRDLGGSVVSAYVEELRTIPSGGSP